jgi:hypothetical protein
MPEPSFSVQVYDPDERGSDSLAKHLHHKIDPIPHLAAVAQEEGFHLRSSSLRRSRPVYPL